MITQKSRDVLQQNKKIVFIPIIQNLHLICMLFSSDGPSNVHHPVCTDASSYALHDFKGGPNRPRYQQTNGRTPSTYAFLIHRLIGIQIMAISHHLYKFSINFQQYQNFFMITACNYSVNNVDSQLLTSFITTGRKGFITHSIKKASHSLKVAG